MKAAEIVSLALEKETKTPEIRIGQLYELDDAAHKWGYKNPLEFIALPEYDKARMVAYLIASSLKELVATNGDKLEGSYDQDDSGD